jgi:hypothetical protein
MGRILLAGVRTRRSSRLPRQQANQQAHRRIDLMQAAVRVFGWGGDACHAVTMTRRHKACLSGPFGHLHLYQYTCDGCELLLAGFDGSNNALAAQRHRRFGHVSNAGIHEIDRYSPNLGGDGIRREHQIPSSVMPEHH